MGKVPIILYITEAIPHSAPLQSKPGLKRRKPKRTRGEMPFPSNFYDQFHVNPAISRARGGIKPCASNRQGKNIYTLNDLNIAGIPS